MGWNKYGARKTTIDGISFPSRLEAETYALLRLQEKSGNITDLAMQETVYLTDAKISYKTDFSFTVLRDLNSTRMKTKIWVEGKGFEGDRWRLIKKLWKHYGPGILQVYKANRRGIYLDEEIIPCS